MSPRLHRLLGSDATIGVGAAVMTFAGTLVAGLAGIVLLDFQVYRWAGEQALSGNLLYAQREPQTDLPYIYPPFAALLFIPFLVTPLVVSQAIWATISVAALARCCHLLCKVGRLESGHMRPHGTWMLFGLALLLEPVQQSLSFGQVNLVVMWLVLEGIMHDRRSHASVSMLAGLAAGIKVTPIALLAGVIFAKTEWKRAAYVLAGFMSSLAVGFLLAPAESFNYWSTVIRDTERVGLAYISNQSLTGVLSRSIDGDISILALSLLSAAVLAWAIYLVRRSYRAGDGIMGLCMLASGMLLASPVSWTHHWVWVLLLLAHMLARIESWPRLTTAVAVTGAVFSTYVIWGVPYGRTEPEYYSWLEVVQGSAYTWSALALLVWGTCHYRGRGAGRIFTATPQGAGAKLAVSGPAEPAR